MKTSTDKRHIAVFASGNGSNAENLVRYFNDGCDKAAEVVLIVSNRPDAKVLQRAESLGIPAAVLSKQEFNDAGRIIPLLEEYSADMVVLAGFLLMVPAFLIARYAGRILNIHPSLLPKFGGKGMYGRYVHEAVVAARERESGITVHIVDEGCDEGRIIFQARTPIEPSDTAEDVERKIHLLEKEHFPKVIDDFCTGLISA